MKLHERHQRIMAALLRGASSEQRRDPAREAAISALRREGIRASRDEIDAVLALALGELLFPACQCIAAEETNPDRVLARGSLGPHHGARCPRWRAVG